MTISCLFATASTIMVLQFSGALCATGEVWPGIALGVFGIIMVLKIIERERATSDDFCEGNNG